MIYIRATVDEQGKVQLPDYVTASLKVEDGNDVVFVINETSHEAKLMAAKHVNLPASPKLYQITKRPHQAVAESGEAALLQPQAV